MKYDDTNIARRYDSARKIPEATMSLWLDSMAARISPAEVSLVLDVGCGTGRFSVPLADRFEAFVIGVDPSETMLTRARENVRHPRVTFRQGRAESLPSEDESACLLFLSMVYHHIERPGQAALEFDRVLRPGGYVCVRNSTRDLLHLTPYLKYFPKAMEINRKRLPSKRGLIETMKAGGLSLLSHDVIEQKFADTLKEYSEKVARRGLSDLTMISDADFKAGIERMKEEVERAGDSGPVMESIDLFVFRKPSGLAGSEG